MAGASAALQMKTNDVQSTANISPNQTVPPTRRRTLLSPPARASTRNSSYKQGVREQEPNINKPFKQDPSAVVTDHRRIAEKLPAPYFDTRVCKSFVPDSIMGKMTNRSVGSV